MSTKAKKMLGKISSSIGLLLISLVMLICLPMTAPRLAGYEVYAIVSGSMEPALPVGSIVYARETNPATLDPGTIVVFYGGQGSETVITHRVMENHYVDGELVTKGDANAGNDVSPIPYANVIGQVTAYMPFLGLFLPALTTTRGKLYLLGVLVAAVLLRVIGGRLEHSAKKAARAAAGDSQQSGVEAQPKKQKKRRKNSTAQLILIFVLLGGLTLAGGTLAAKVISYFRNATVDTEPAEQIEAEVSPTPVPATPAPMETFEPEETPEPEPLEDPPITIDWDEYLAINPELVGWLYMPNSVINYPVMQTTDNDYYLHHNINGHYSDAGTLFVDVGSMSHTIRSNFIIYGHHMANGSMFASLDTFKSNPGYYDDHKVLYYLTPEGINYRVDLIAAHIVESVEENFPLYFKGIDEYQEYLDQIVADSLFEAEAEPSTKCQLMTMSTCDYTRSYNDPRMLVHGMMIRIADTETASLLPETVEIDE